MLTMNEARQKLQLSNEIVTITNIKKQVESLLKPFTVVSLTLLDDEKKRIVYKYIDEVCEAYFKLIIVDFDFRTQKGEGSYLQVEEYIPYKGIDGTLFDKITAIDQIKQTDVKLGGLLDLPYLNKNIVELSEEQIEKNDKLYYEMLAGLSPEIASLVLGNMMKKKDSFNDLVPQIVVANYAIDYYMQQYRKSL